MAKSVTAVQLGAQPQIMEDMTTVQEIMDYFDIEGVSIKVSGQTQSASYELQDYDFVSFGEKVKGG